MIFRFSKQLALLLILASLTLAFPARADKIDELKDQIDEKQDAIEEIEEEIAEYREELQEVNKEKTTLQGAIYTLDLSRNKVTADINSTQNRIDSAELSIEKLNLEIADQERKISLNNDTIGETIRRIHEAESQSLIETILTYDNLSDFWGKIDNAQQFQVALLGDIDKLQELKAARRAKIEELENEKISLSGFRSELQGQRAVIDVNKQEKDQLLSVTKSEEAKYQQLIAQKQQLRAQFEAEMREAEAALKFEIDPESIPSTGSGVLAWPVDNPIITQYFGNTAFASANPQIYNGNGHNGIDFGVGYGSRVKSALAGTVLGTGDTDLVCPNASYGKWVLVKHNNGLTTVYGHLSQISVSKGQNVRTGETIAFSGNSGYSTGPHLHFTVFASQGVEVRTLPSKACGGRIYTIPLADRSAYLNPLSYL